MAITYVRPDDRLHLQSIASLFSAASKIVTVTGAGISTNTSIPASIPASLPTHLSPDLGFPIKKWHLFPQKSPPLSFFSSV